MISATTLSPDDPILAERAGAWRSAYIHIPFCARVCPYCDFAVVAGQDDLADRYVDALLSEIDLHPSWETLDAVSFGGGTPSRIAPARLGTVIERLRDKFGLGNDVEISMEANPEDWHAEYAENAAEVGITRVSLGAQSFDDEVLARLGRVHQSHQVSSAVRAAQSSDLAVSVDLMFGEPSESIASWRHSVQSALQLELDHVSTYALTVERGTELSRQVAAGAEPPDEDDQADKYEIANEALLEAGLVRYEVSNAAVVGQACKYNLSTWAQGDYLAFGLGAHGHVGGVRRRNVRRLDKYLAEIDQGRRPTAGEEEITGWSAEIERLMLGLRRSAGVVLGRGGTQFVEDARSVPFFERGIIEVFGERLVVTQPLLTDAVIREILDLADPDSSKEGYC